MKKTTSLIGFICFFSSIAHAQEKLKIFKFDPLPLVTSALSFGIENFNEDRSRSTVFHLGIRYKKDNDNYGNPVILNNVQQSLYSDWKGLFATVERRFYVPSFKDKGANFLNSEASQSGVYFSPSLRLDVNQNDYARNSYGYIHNPISGQQDYVDTFSSGKTNFIGIMPAMNFGVQFTIFQYAYIDLHIGGGIRVQNTTEKDGVGFPSSYNNYANSITTFVTKEGVQPTGGITFGLKL